MKPSTTLFPLLATTCTLAVTPQPQQPPSAIDPSPSVPNVTPPAPLPQQQQDLTNPSHGYGSLISGVDIAPQQTDTNAIARTLVLRGRTKSLQARSEGTLGQSPWIGMAIGLTCTALAAVTLG